MFTSIANGGNKHPTGTGLHNTLSRQTEVEPSTGRGADGTMENTTRTILAMNQIYVISVMVDS